MKFMRYLFLVSLVLLTSCVSAEERARRQNESEIAECTRMGFKEKTEAFANCRLQLRSISANQATARAAATGAAQQNYWNTYNAVTAPYRNY